MVNLDNRDLLHGGFKGTCSSCPFNEGMNEDGSRAQNLGCLPSGGDILQLKRETGNNWACHDEDSKVCTGLCLHAKENNFDMSKGILIHEPGVHAAARQPQPQEIVE
jgi:hypothetical protein